MAEAIAETTRRDFLYVATAAFAGLGAAGALVPWIAQRNPDASTIAMGGPVDFDMSKLAPGQQAMVFWRSRPIFIINRSRGRGSGWGASVILFACEGF